MELLLRQPPDRSRGDLRPVELPWADPLASRHLAAPSVEDTSRRVVRLLRHEHCWFARRRRTWDICPHPDTIDAVVGLEPRRPRARHRAMWADLPCEPAFFTGSRGGSTAGSTGASAGGAVVDQELGGGDIVVVVALDRSPLLAVVDSLSRVIGHGLLDRFDQTLPALQPRAAPGCGPPREPVRQDAGQPQPSKLTPSNAATSSGSSGSEGSQPSGNFAFFNLPRISRARSWQSSPSAPMVALQLARARPVG